MNLLNYVPGDSFLHRLNPVTKLVAAFMYGIAAILCENVFAEVGFIIFILLISATAGWFKRALFRKKRQPITGDRRICAVYNRWT